MHIRLINPNTTAAMTQLVAAQAQAVAAPGTVISAVNPLSGPSSIESHFDEAISVVGVCQEVLQGEKEAVDAYVIACFGDPGLWAARELTKAPVIGIAHAAFVFASMLSTRFSIVTSLDRTKIQAEHLLMQYGLQHHCRQIRAVDLPVLTLEENSSLEMVIAECEQARDQDQIGAIVLGCAALAGHRQHIEQRVGLPIIDGVSAAVKMAESLVALQLQTSKVGDLAFPPDKQFTGMFSAFSQLGKNRLSIANEDLLVQPLARQQ